jgi:hypothetical protein
MSWKVEVVGDKEACEYSDKDGRLHMADKAKELRGKPSLSELAALPLTWS